MERRRVTSYSWLAVEVPHAKSLEIRLVELELEPPYS